MSEHPPEAEPGRPQPETAAGEPRQRPLGVIEAMVAARDQCPHAAVRETAAAALMAVRGQGADVLRQQAFLVLSTLAGWRGERAFAVRRALQQFLEATAPARAPGHVPAPGRTP